jgi:hypothetical protein
VARAGAVSARVALAAALAGALGLALLAGAGRAGAQARPPVLEARGDVLAGRTTSWHAGAGAAWRLGGYVQLGLVAAGGVTRGPASRVDDGTAPSGRAELVARFVVDPRGGEGLRWYGGAGAGALFVRGARGLARVHVVAGVEGRPRGRVRVGAEVGVGGGARVGLVLRRAEPPEG